MLSGFESVDPFPDRGYLIVQSVTFGNCLKPPIVTYAVWMSRFFHALCPAIAAIVSDVIGSL